MHLKKDSLIKMVVAFLVLVIVGVFTFFMVNFSNFFGGPQPDDSVKELEGQQISFGEFLLLTSLSLDSVKGKVAKSYDDEVTFEELKESKIDGIDALEYVKQKVSKDMDEILLNLVAANRLKLKLNSTDENSIKSQADSTFKKLNERMKAYKIGISRRDCYEYFKGKFLEQKIGEGLYGKGKENEIKEEEINNFINDGDKFAAYTVLKFPNKLEELTLEQCKKKKKEKKKGEKEGEDEEEEEKEEEEIKEEKKDNKAIVEKFNVDKADKLADDMFSQIKKGSLSFEEAAYKLNKVFKDNYPIPKIETKIFDGDNDAGNPYSFLTDKEYEEELKKNLKELKDNECLIFTYKDEKHIIKRIPINEEIIKAKSESVKGKMEEDRKKQYMDNLREEIKDKIEINENILGDNNYIEKQLKLTMKNEDSKQRPMF